MPEATSGTGETAEAVEQVQEVTETPIDVKAIVQKELTAMQVKHKLELAGLNRKVEEQRKEKQQLELEKLSEQDRLKKETEILRNEKDLIEQETKQLTRARLVDKSLFDAGLPQDFANRINGDDENSILEDVKAFQEFINNEAEKRVEALVNKRLGGEAPKAGANVTGSERAGLIAQYNEAEKNGNGAKMMALKDQIRKLPKE